MNRRDFLQLGLATAAGWSPVFRSFGEQTPMATDPLRLHRFGADYTPSKHGKPLDPPSVRLGAAMSARAYAGDPRKPTSRGQPSPGLIPA